MIRRLLAVACLLFVARPAGAQTALTGGKLARFIDKSNDAADSATLNFVKEPGLGALLDPRCPTSSSLRLSSSNQVNVEVPLDCSKWKLAGAVYRYSAKPGGPGGVGTIVYKLGGLKVVIKGST